MKFPQGVLILSIGIPSLLGFVGQESVTKKQDVRKTDQVSFANDVAPIIGRYCLPCHAEESYNPSELSLDSYELLMKGGKHGAALVPGKPAESILVQKLGSEPPFGDQMPVSRRRKNQTPPKRLTEEEVKIIADWVEQGGKDN